VTPDILIDATDASRWPSDPERRRDATEPDSRIARDELAPRSDRRRIMRSFTLTAALAAVLVSTSLAGAFAASAPTATGTPLPGSAPQMQSVMPDAMTTGAITAQAQAAPKPAHFAMQHETLRPRLAHIDRQLGAANHRMTVDHGRGYLTAAEYRMLRARSHDIRLDAQRTASNHRGALPKSSFVTFQNRIDRLNREIHHAVTT
jgi:hypothetical protein